MSFDTCPDRRGTGSNKWGRYPEDVLPLWVADMDYSVAEPIRAALARRLDHPVFGYARPQPDLREAVVVWLRTAHGWRVDEGMLDFLPGLEPGFNMALRALLAPGSGVVLETPAYAPLLRAPGTCGHRRLDVPLIADSEGWACDLDRLADVLPKQGAILLCNPQNPTGKSYTRAELEVIAEIALRQDALIVSDEIHCDLVLGGDSHIPIASLSREVAARTVTLMAPSKTWNIAGLKTAFAIVPDAEMRARFSAHRLGLVDSVNAFGLEACRAAYAECGAWRDDLVAYLTGNRDHLAEALASRFPGLAMRKPQATFLAWIDCAGLALDRPAAGFFLEHARVALSCGTEFADPDGRHLRLNFGCPRATLDVALDRMEAAISQAAQRG